MLPPVDQGLRRMVVDLAALQSDDVAAVLAELSIEQRQTVERLLRDFSGFGFPAPSQTEKAVSYDPARIAPWLIECFEKSDTNMTAEARETLRNGAIEIFPAQSPQDLRPPVRFGLFGRRKRSP